MSSTTPATSTPSPSIQARLQGLGKTVDAIPTNTPAAQPAPTPASAGRSKKAAPLVDASLEEGSKDAPGSAEASVAGKRLPALVKIALLAALAIGILWLVRKFLPLIAGLFRKKGKRGGDITTTTPDGRKGPPVLPSAQPQYAPMTPNYAPFLSQPQATLAYSTKGERPTQSTEGSSRSGPLEIVEPQHPKRSAGFLAEAESAPLEQEEPAPQPRKNTSPQSTLLHGPSLSPHAPLNVSAAAASVRSVHSVTPE